MYRHQCCSGVGLIDAYSKRWAFAGGVTLLTSLPSICFPGSLWLARRPKHSWQGPVLPKTMLSPSVTSTTRGGVPIHGEMQLQACLHDPRLWATSSGYTACNSKKSLRVGIASPTVEATPTPFLINDPDCDFILDGIKFGFKIIEPPDMDGNIEMNNYKSTREHATLVEAEIQKEIMEGRCIVTPGKPKIVSALGALPKSDGAIRLIHDASRPSSSAVNDYSAAIPKQRFQSLQDVINLVTPNCFFAKLDLKAAYRSVGIHPSNYPYMGLKWLFEGDTQPTYLIDNRLCFGAKNSPGIFHRITQAMRRMMKKRGCNIVCFLDDILLIADDYAQCKQGYTELIWLVRALGFAIA